MTTDTCTEHAQNDSTSAINLESGNGRARRKVGVTDASVSWRRAHAVK